MRHARRRAVNLRASIALALALFASSACAPRIVGVHPAQGGPGTVVNVATEYLIGWPRVEIAGKTMDWSELELIAADPQRGDVPGEELIWIEDKYLRFKIPDLPPGEYVVTIHDDKGPPGDLVYSFLETTAYVMFPPVWPFVFRSNRAQFDLRVLPKSDTIEQSPRP